MIRRFESARRLHSAVSVAGLLGAGVACKDPPDPPIVDRGVRSEAHHVEWRPDAAPVERPIARVVDAPGGTLDRLVADDDVTTVLNDRFHPIYRETGSRVGEPDAPVGTLQFFRADGCPLTLPIRVGTTSELIDVANAILLRDDAAGPAAPTLSLRCGADPG